MQSSPEVVFQEDEFLINSGSQSKVMKMYGSPRFTADDELDGAILTYAEITDLVQAQTDLQQQKNELSELASIMRHDLMNFLHNIMGYAELLEIETQNDHTQRIIDNALHIRRVLDRSYELAEAGKVIDKKEQVNLEEVVDKIAEMIIPKTVNFSRTKLPTLMCDKEKVTQIFQNIFKNAVTHANPSKIEVVFSSRNNKIDRISIKNDGNLIPEETKNMVFNRGFTSSKEGSSLGLYITKKLCNAHHWDIIMEVTGVTSFHIDIPL